jgi:hypothetical protein
MKRVRYQTPGKIIRRLRNSVSTCSASSNRAPKKEFPMKISVQRTPDRKGQKSLRQRDEHSIPAHPKRGSMAAQCNQNGPDTGEMLPNQTREHPSSRDWSLISNPRICRETQFHRRYCPESRCISPATPHFDRNQTSDQHSRFASCRRNRRSQR